MVEAGVRHAIFNLSCQYQRYTGLFIASKKATTTLI